MRARTFVIGDIHGDSAALETLLARLPELTPADTLVLLGDYVDRGPDSAGVVRRVWRLQSECPARVVALRGNHEDMWLQCMESPHAGFLLARGNGCAETFRSFTGGPPLGEDEGLSEEEFRRYVDVPTWMPADVLGWMSGLALWYEDENGIYVHAGVEGEGEAWKHPRDCAPKPLMWMRARDFYQGYAGKRLVFGHTPVSELPTDHVGPIARIFDDPKDVWVRGDLIGIDTACGKGGFLSAVELPAMRVYESR
jgi:serine/threonine protein phosphatase 1